MIADDIEDIGIFTPEGGYVGEIEDLVIDLDENRIVLAVVEVEGIASLKDKFLALPWKLFEYDKTDKRFILTKPKEVLEQAETFTQRHYPDYTDPAWIKKTQDDWL